MRGSMDILGLMEYPVTNNLLEVNLRVPRAKSGQLPGDRQTVGLAATPFPYSFSIEALSQLALPPGGLA